MTNALNMLAPVDTLGMNFTREFEGAPDMVNLEFMTFEDLGDGRARLKGRSICPNIGPVTRCWPRERPTA